MRKLAAGDRVVWCASVAFALLLYPLEPLLSRLCDWKWNRERHRAAAKGTK